MIVARLRSNDVPTRQVAMLVGEMWAVFVLWIGVLWAASRRLAPSGISSGYDFREMVARFAHFSVGDKILTIASLVLGIAVFVHFSMSLRRAMQAPDADQD